MKFTMIIFLVSVLGVALATPYIMKRVNSGGDWSVSTVYTPPASTAETRQTFYKWQDASGQWHFGNDKPEGVDVVEVNIDTAANIIAPVGTPKSDKPEQELITPEVKVPDSPVVMPGQALELIDQAKQVKAMMESRYQYQEEN